MDSVDGENLSFKGPHTVQVGPVAIHVIKKELVEGGVDVLVCPYNNFWFKPSDDLDYAIARAAGPNLRQDCKAWVVARKENMEPGSCMTTDGHDLNCKKVIHVYCPSYQGAIEKVAVQQLEITLRNILVLVMQLQADSLALPLVGASTSYPASIATNVLVKLVLEVAKQLAGDPQSCPLREVQLVDTVDEHLHLMVQALDEHCPAAEAAATTAAEQAAAGNKPAPSPILARAPPVRVEPKMLQVVRQAIKQQTEASAKPVSEEEDAPSHPENGVEAHAPLTPAANGSNSSNGRSATVRQRVAQIVAFIEERVAAEDGSGAAVGTSKPSTQPVNGDTTTTLQAHARRDSSSGSAAGDGPNDAAVAAEAGPVNSSSAGQPNCTTSTSGRVAQLANKWRAAARSGPPALSADGDLTDLAGIELSQATVTPADSAPATPPPEPCDEPASSGELAAAVMLPEPTPLRPAQADGVATVAAPAQEVSGTALPTPDDPSEISASAEDCEAEPPVRLSRSEPTGRSDAEAHAPAVLPATNGKTALHIIPTLAELAVAAHAAVLVTAAPEPAPDEPDSADSSTTTEGNAAGTLKGVVKKFDDDKGWGFIAPLTGGSKIFVHIRDVRTSKLVEGDIVQYVEGEDRHGRRCATEVVVAQKARCRRSKGPKQAAASSTTGSDDLAARPDASNSDDATADLAPCGDCGQLAEAEAAAPPRSAARTRAFRQALGAAITDRTPA